MKTIEITDDTMKLLKEVSSLEEQWIGKKTEFNFVVNMALRDKIKELEKLIELEKRIRKNA